VVKGGCIRVRLVYVCLGRFATLSLISLYRRFLPTLTRFGIGPVLPENSLLRLLITLLAAAIILDFPVAALLRSFPLAEALVWLPSLKFCGAVRKPKALAK
jgi:hypothetical protein